jgi:hypothetical protein
MGDAPGELAKLVVLVSSWPDTGSKVETVRVRLKR